MHLMPPLPAEDEEVPAVGAEGEQVAVLAGGDRVELARPGDGLLDRRPKRLRQLVQLEESQPSRLAQPAQARLSDLSAEHVGLGRLDGLQLAPQAGDLGGVRRRRRAGVRGHR